METEFYALHPVLWYAAFVATLLAFSTGTIYVLGFIQDYVDESKRGSLGFVGMLALCALLFGAFQIIGNPPVWFVLVSLACGAYGYYAGLGVSEMEEPEETPFILLFFTVAFAFGWIPAILFLLYEEVIDPLVDDWKAWRFSRYLKNNARKRALERGA